ncbi:MULTISPECIES: hypothetical protein [Kordiimonas]|uniref:hypothetical protein n=1 Tax=Kordiimonas TaxID=288021 RepID=UPI00257D8618|nr:hypothetical protein [Kordiimonas sp. UBA4487]
MSIFNSIGGYRYTKLLLVTISTLMLLAGLSRVLHELMLVAGTNVSDQLSRGKSVTADDLDLLVKSRLRAIQFYSTPKAYSDLGTAYLALSGLANELENRRRYARLAETAANNGLTLSPLNSYLWLKLASARVVLGNGHQDGAVEAWRKSIETAKFEPFILFQRVHVGILLFDSLSQEEIALLKEQLVLSYHWNRGQLWQYAHAHKLFDWMAFLTEPNSAMSTYLKPKQ